MQTIDKNTPGLLARIKKDGTERTRTVPAKLWNTNPHENDPNRQTNPFTKNGYSFVKYELDTSQQKDRH